MSEVEEKAEAAIATRLTRRFLKAIGYLPPAPSRDRKADEETTGLGSRPVVTRTAAVAFPSLFDTVKSIGAGFSSHEDVLMQAVETWPLSRVDVLMKAREKLRANLSRVARSDVDLTDVFDRVHLLGTGEYGAVYIACVRRDSGFGCERFFVDVKDMGRLEVTVFMAVKTARTPERVLSYMRSLRGAPVFSASTRDGTWFGHANVMREVLLGRFLNHLVQAGVTPHFPMVYESFEVRPPGTVAIAMELCHMDFDTFLNKVLPRLGTNPLRMQMLKVALAQLAHGIAAAQLRLDFRHNDLHSKNAMMTFIRNTVYTYVVRGTAYPVPNLGMCWKLTDFGFGSSSYLFDALDTVHALRHTGAARRVGGKERFPNHAVEAVDFLRLLRNASVSGQNTMYTPQVDFCERLEAEIHELAGPAAGSARAFSAKIEAKDAHKMLEASQSRGLMTRVFTLLAAPLGAGVDAGAETDGPTYDLDAKMYQHGLSGVERRYYDVHSSGALFKR